MLMVLPVLPSHWRVLKELRLQVLKDAPEAFTSTLSQAQARTDAEWQQFAARWPAAHLAYADGGDPCGMIGGAFCPPLRHEHDKAAEMLAFWVAPEHRRQGVGRALAAAIIDWAVAHGAQELHAKVAPGNAKAVAFYKHLGFRQIEYAAPDENHLFLLSMETITTLRPRPV